MMVTKQPCSVCGEAGDGAHFGAEACRACAAFFRRSVALSKTYVCRALGECVIQKNVRCMCRSCRFAKCIAVGMRKSAVQRHREVMGKSESNENMQSLNGIGWPIELAMTSVEGGMEILNKLSENYAHMESIRKVIHNRRGDTIFSVREPQAIAYREANNIHLREIGIVADWVVKSYPDFERLPHDQKKLLYRNFYVPFMILECGYYCCLKNRTDLIYLPSGDYIDCSKPETFYNDSYEKHLMTSEDAVRMFGPSFEIYRRNILDPMKREKVDSYEFFTLCSLVLWDHGLEGQSEECVLLARSTRDRILREILHYYRTVKNLVDPSMRLANLLVLLPALQRSVRRFQEDVEITHVFNVYSVEEKFYELVSGRLADNFFQLGDKPIKAEEVECVWDLNSGEIVETYSTPCYELTDYPSTSSSSSM